MLAACLLPCSIAHLKNNAHITSTLVCADRPVCVMHNPLLGCKLEITMVNQDLTS
jgi:hypothetical protein